MKRIWIIGLYILISLCVSVAFSQSVHALALSEGDDGDRVMAIQLRLIDMGYNVPKASGIFDARTTRAVTTYQKHARLGQTGVVDDITWYFLMDYGRTGRYGPKEVQKLINTATRLIGIPYVFGGETTAGFDCSAFVQYVFREAGIQLPRTADVQFELGRKVMREELRAGDIVFFETYEPGASHNGIYIGEGRFIGANSGTGVAIANLGDAYWSSHYYGARRLF